MQLPAFFGHKKAINLLPRDSFEASSVGVILSWLLVFGKWSVIITQLIVMGAFLWRFGLDRQLTDLKKAIAKDVAIIKSYDQIERDFILTQKRLEIAREVIIDQNLILGNLDTIAKATPIDVWYEKLTISDKATTFTAYSRSLVGFSTLLSTLQNDPKYSSVAIGKIQDGGTQGAQLQFEITLQNASDKKEKK